MSVSTNHWRGRRLLPSQYLLIFPSGNGCLLIDNSGNTRRSSGKHSEGRRGGQSSHPRGQTDLFKQTFYAPRAHLTHRYGPTRYNWLYRKIIYGGYWCVHAPRNDPFPPRRTGFCVFDCLFVCLFVDSRFVQRIENMFCHRCLFGFGTVWFRGGAGTLWFRLLWFLCVCVCVSVCVSECCMVCRGARARVVCAHFHVASGVALRGHVHGPVM